MEQAIDHLENKDKNNNDLSIPQRFNQQHKWEEYTIDACTEDQKQILAYILKYVKTWYELDKTQESIKTFKPLKMNFCGQAGSGKSTLINTLVTAIRKIFQKNNSVYVCGPTGSAAFNAGGETCHHLFSIPTKMKETVLAEKAQKTLNTKLEDTIALIIDERSKLSSFVLGTMENYCRQAAFKGTQSHLSWGGLPIVILVGDDYQLPAIDEGAFYCHGKQTNCTRTSEEHFMVQNGMEWFMKMGENVMTLKQSKRVLQEQKHLQHILQCLRGESDQILTQQDAEYLCS